MEIACTTCSRAKVKCDRQVNLLLSNRTRRTSILRGYLRSHAADVPARGLNASPNQGRAVLVEHQPGQLNPIQKPQIQRNPGEPQRTSKQIHAMTGRVAQTLSIPLRPLTTITPLGLASIHLQRLSFLKTTALPRSTVFPPSEETWSIVGTIC